MVSGTGGLMVKTPVWWIVGSCPRWSTQFFTMVARIHDAVWGDISFWQVKCENARIKHPA